MVARDFKHAVISRFSPKSVTARALFIRVSFYLALSDRVLAMKRIQQLFAEYGMEMPELLEARSARYLNGSIDLVYFDGQRYHIADYKSNYLGENLADYSVESIAQSMSLASYWLQAPVFGCITSLFKSQNAEL